jgi:predicted secreted hydrolase
MKFRYLKEGTILLIFMILVCLILGGSGYFFNNNVKNKAPKSTNMLKNNSKNATSKSGEITYSDSKNETPIENKQIIEFPKDEGRHDDAIVEWWYFNGHLQDQDGKQYGVMICFFKNGNLYYGLADESNDKFYGGIEEGQLIASDEKLDISIGSNTWTEPEQFTYKLHTEKSGSYLDLNMVNEKTPLLIGGNGLIPIGTKGTSYYYSLTKLKIGGKLNIGNGEKTINGIGWIDKQWGNWDESGYSGWDWFSVQLNNSVDMNVFVIYDPLSHEPINPMINLIDAGNKTEIIKTFTLRNPKNWSDPQTGNTFPNKWDLVMPEKGIELQITPTIDNQLITPNLWEGSCKVTGVYGNEEVSGWAYTELNHN